MSARPVDPGMALSRCTSPLMALLGLLLTTLLCDARQAGTVFRILGCLPSASQTDSDGDGLTDVWERAHGLDPFDPTDAASDWDGDGLTALQESLLNSDPWRMDSDSDGVVDAADPSVLGGLVDSDGDGLPDDWELFWFGSLAHQPTQDDDADGDGDLIEYRLGSDPGAVTRVDDSGLVTLQIFRPAG